MGSRQPTLRLRCVLLHGASFSQPLCLNTILKMPFNKLELWFRLACNRNSLLRRGQGPSFTWGVVPNTLRQLGWQPLRCQEYRQARTTTPDFITAEEKHLYAVSWASVTIKITQPKCLTVWKINSWSSNHEYVPPPLRTSSFLLRGNGNT